jgi:hypothetical protein
MRAATLPFASLDFEGHPVLTVDQIAAKLNFTAQHILNLVDQGDLVAIDGRRSTATRRCCRIPAESYCAFVMARLTSLSPETKTFIAQLPRSVRIDLMRELKESFAC